MEDHPCERRGKTPHQRALPRLRKNKVKRNGLTDRERQDCKQLFQRKQP